MRKKAFGSFNIRLMGRFPRYAILRCKRRVASYMACDISQDARTHLMEAYMRFPKRKNEALRLHNEACNMHMETCYSSPHKEAEIALRLASFRLHHMNDPKGAEFYETSAYDLARGHGITSILSRVYREFPQLLLT